MVSGITMTGTIDAGEGFYVNGTPVSAAAVVWEQGTFAQGAPTLVVEGGGVLTGGAGLPVTLSIASGAGAEFEQGTVTAAGVITLSSDFTLSTSGLAMSPSGPLANSLATVGTLASAAQPKIAAASGEILFGPSTLGGAPEPVTLGPNLSLSGTALDLVGLTSINGVEGAFTLGAGMTLTANTLSAPGGIDYGGTLYSTLVAGSGVTITPGGTALTVSASGGGTAIYAAQVPALSQWSTINGTILTSSEGSVVGSLTSALNITTSANNNSNNSVITGLYRNVPGTPYRIAVAILWKNANTTSDVGIGFYSSVSGKFETMSCVWSGSTPEIYRITWNAYNSAVSVASSMQLFQDFPGWLGIRDDGTNIYFEYSYDSVEWFIFYSSAKSSGFLGSAGYTQSVLFLDPNSFSAGQIFSATVLCWDESGLTRSLASVYG